MLDIGALLRSTLGDARREARALEMAKAIVQGQASATHGPEGVGHRAPWDHAIGVYRFLDNNHITLPAMYRSSLRGLQQLVPVGQRCYVVHDISVVDYTGHEGKNDLIAVGNEHTWGYELFSSLVLDAKGRPLGPVLQELRAQQGVLSSQSPTPLPFVDHMTQVERALQVVRSELAGREAVHLCDREFDDLQLLRFIQSSSERYVIRAQHMGRWIEHQGQRTTVGKAAHQVSLVRAGTVEKKGKQYELFVGQTEVTFDGLSFRGVARKRDKPKSGPSILVRVVVSELRREGEKPLRWVLLTNLGDEALEVVQAYIWRWRVERFFYLTKVGLRLEQWRQETAERVARRLGVSQLAAMAIYQMQAAAEVDPVAADLIKAVATLGGWLGRKRDPIGPIVLMRGAQLLLGMMSALEEHGEAKLRDLALRLTEFLGFSTSARSKEADVYN